jgi:hypothetical protein
MRRAPSFPKAPFISMAISRILSFAEANRMIIYLSPFARTARSVCTLHDATIPEDQPRKDSGLWRTGCPPSVLSCTTWGFSCLADYSASGELLPRLFTLACTSLPKNRRCLFCDTFRRRSLGRTPPACFTRHAAVWCSDFPLTRPAIAGRVSDHLPSRAFYHGNTATQNARLNERSLEEVRH